MEWLVVWLVLAVIVGAAAAARNRTGFGWFVLAVLISPVLAGLLLALIGRGDAGLPPAGAFPQRNCPECRELVRADAKLCKHCHTKLTPIM